jgi:hypothetical protein
MTQKNTDLLLLLSQSLEIELPQNLSAEELLNKLSFHINHLIRSDFQKLISILYRVDVDENRLKQLLEQNADRDAATIIAELLIERQIQKIRSRKQNKPDKNISDEEKW